MKIILTIFAVFLIVILKYLTYDTREYKSNINYHLLKDEIVKKILTDLKYNEKEYKAFSVTIDEYSTYAYAYVSNEKTQNDADKKANELCELSRKQKNINKKCMIYNDLIYMDIIKKP